MRTLPSDHLRRGFEWVGCAGVLLLVIVGTLAPAAAQGGLGYRRCRKIPLKVIAAADSPIAFLDGTRLCRPPVSEKIAGPLRRPGYDRARWRLIAQNRSSSVLNRFNLVWDLFDRNGEPLRFLVMTLDQNPYGAGPLSWKPGKRLIWEAEPQWSAEQLHDLIVAATVEVRLVRVIGEEGEVWPRGGSLQEERASRRSASGSREPARQFQLESSPDGTPRSGRQSR